MSSSRPPGEEAKKAPAASVRFRPDDFEPDGDWIEIGNEFATVKLRRVLTRNGVRLQVHSSKLDADVFLDPVLLESLTWQTTESLSLFLETPLEPFKSAEQR